jgi:hypothetical protein
MPASQPIETFDVVVGSPPDWEIFTVPRDLLVCRSDFFDTIRSPRWMRVTHHSSTMPVDLSEEYPDTFMAYLHCVYWDQVILNARMEGDVQRYDLLIELYTLADRLLDFTTADLVIDKIISSVHEQLLLPSLEDIKLVYATTVEGSPLRRLMVDKAVYSEAMRLSGPKDEYPHEYLQDVVGEFMALKDILPELYRPDPDATSNYHRDAHAALLSKLSSALVL